MATIWTAAFGLLGLLVGAAVWAWSARRAEAAPNFAGDAAPLASPTPVPASPARVILSAAKDLAPATATAQPAQASLAAATATRSPETRREPGSPSLAQPLFLIAAAGYFALAAATFGDDPWRLAAALVCAVPLAAVALIDARTRLIFPDVILVGTLVGLLFAARDGLPALLDAAATALAAGAVFGLLALLAGRVWGSAGVVPFGSGDALLALMIGAMTGPRSAAPALFLGVVLAGVAAAALLAFGRNGRRDAIAYGPWLCLGALVTLLR